MSEDPTMPDLLANTAASQSITPELLLQKMRSDIPLMIVDVRDRASVALGTLKGARSFPLRQLNARLPELFGSRSSTVVVVSRTGSRARTAATILCLGGFQDVYVLEGGIDQWARLDYPIAAPESVRPPSLTAPRGVPRDRGASGTR